MLSFFRLPSPSVQCCSTDRCMMGLGPTGRLSYTSVRARITVGSVRCSLCRRPIVGDKLAPCVICRHKLFDMGSSTFVIVCQSFVDSVLMIPFKLRRGGLATSTRSCSVVCGGVTLSSPCSTGGFCCGRPIAGLPSPSFYRVIFLHSIIPPTRSYLKGDLS